MKTDDAGRRSSVVARRTSHKDLELTYYEGDRRLSVNLELAGDALGGWSGLESDLRCWSEPADVALTDIELARVAERFHAWAAEHGKRLRFGPAADWSVFEQWYIERGWRPVRSVDSAGHATVTFQPPLLTRLRWLLERMRRRRP